MTDREDIRPEDMYEPIERLFEREYPTEHGFFEARPERTNGSTPVHLIYLAGSSEALHAVRIEATYDACIFNIDGGIHGMANAVGNFRWVALPLDEFRAGEESYNDIMLRTCQQRNLGIITVQHKGRGLSAKVIAAAKPEEGNALAQYPDMRARWEEHLRHNPVLDGYQVVDYYDR